MLINEAGISPRSVRYFFTPSSFAERIFFYPTRIGHYFCGRDYHFHSGSEVAMQPGHHFHYMIFLIKQGMMELELDGAHSVAARDAAVLFDCKRAHEYRALTDDLEFYWLVFDGPMSETFYTQILEMRDGAHTFPAADPAQLQLLFVRLLTYAELSARRPEHSLSELIYSMLCGLLAGPHGADGRAGTLVDRALGFMDQHFADDLPVDDIAAHVGLSTSHFTKYFRRQTGYSPHEYVVLRRIDHAKELLLSTDQTVKQIAYATGYNSEENFIRSFKKKVGVPPSSFRRYPV
ncbi:MAG: AraC family transcriptional regulator [Eubacteriales bacterium]|nr:AraC family transcriptional regulator [Eubacteriales bacterium]